MRVRDLAIKNLVNDLTSELSEYEAVRSGQLTTFKVNGIDDLGDALVKARIAKGWTHRQLSRVLGVSEQMIQKDEARSYERAGLARLADIADGLGYELTGWLRPSAPHASLRVVQTTTITLTTLVDRRMFGLNPGHRILESVSQRTSAGGRLRFRIRPVCQPCSPGQSTLTIWRCYVLRSLIQLTLMRPQRYSLMRQERCHETGMDNSR